MRHTAIIDACRAGCPPQAALLAASDDAGELTSTKDARDLTLAYDYDKLGRKVAERVGTTVLADWAYDKADVGGAEVNEPGALISSTRHRGTEDYTVATTGFNSVGRPLGTRIELDEDGFKTAYTTSQNWTSTGLVKEEHLADSRNGTAGGVAGEKITHDYDTFGNPISTTGINGYVTETLMSPYGEVNRHTLGANNLTAWISYQRDEMTRRTSEVMLSASISPPQVEKTAYTYDPAGNITKTVNTQGGGTSAPVQTQCYQYTSVNQLARVWSSLDNCATTPTGTNRTKVGGPQKFWHAWNFDAAGNRTKQVKYGATSADDATTIYTTATTGPTHALGKTSTTVGTGAAVERTFGYDANGNMNGRVTATGKNQTLNYDRHNWVDSVATTGGNTVSYEYDADGNQLLRRDGATTTLYLPGQEVTVNTTTKATTVTSYYSHGGQVVATRQDDLNPRYLLPDQHGTNQVAISPVGWAVSRRYYDPYGNVLGTKGTWPVAEKHGFLNKPQNLETGLTDVGARKYDPTIGRFISVDPMLMADDPRQLNGYQYGGNNPVNNADPTGLMLLAPDGGSPSPMPEYIEALTTEPQPVPPPVYDFNYTPEPDAPAAPKMNPLVKATISGMVSTLSAGKEVSDYVTHNAEAISQAGLGALEMVGGAGVAAAGLTVAAGCAGLGIATSWTGVGGVAGGACAVGAGAVAVGGALISVHGASQMFDGIAKMESPPGGGASRQTGQSLEAVDDVFANPKLLEGKSPAEVRKILEGTPGWESGTLRHGRNAGSGWGFRERNSSGTDYTGRYIQWHPGSSRHFRGQPYWKVSSGPSGTVRFPQ